MKLINRFLSTTALLAMFNAAASSDASILTIRIGDNYDQVNGKLAYHCPAVKQQSVTPPRFPLAKHGEKHLICESVKGGGKAAVVLADGKVSHIYAEDINEELIAKPSGQTNQYLGYRVYSGHQLWTKDKTATLIDTKALHPNLYVWKNPHISEDKSISQPIDNGLPAVLKFGATLDELKPAFEAHCQPMEILETKVWLLNKPKQQIQVNCFNYDYLGFPRKIEAVFGDGVLELAWILTAEEEEARVRQGLIQNHGNAIVTKDDWEVFDQGRVYLRKDKPEVLAVSEKLVPLIRQSYGL